MMGSGTQAGNRLPRETGLLNFNALASDSLQDVAHIRRLVSEAVEDNLATIDNPSVDVPAAAAEILAFVFHGVTDPSAFQDDARRYETYYALMGKAVAVAQGWKHNCASALKPGQTKTSVREYVEKTYGYKAQPAGK